MSDTPSSSQTPRRLAEGLRHRRAGATVVLVAGVGSLAGVLSSDHGPAILAALLQVARGGWPAVALAVSVLAFGSLVRVVAAVLGAVQLLAEQMQRLAAQLRAGEERTEQTGKALQRIEENQEQIAIVLERLVERTQPGLGGPPMSSPPQGPQRSAGG
jgi:mannitol-specific phosphotransferase system IIBC component